jgi:hypothetical protein
VSVFFVAFSDTISATAHMAKIPQTKQGTVPITWDEKRRRWMLSYFAPETPEQRRARLARRGALVADEMRDDDTTEAAGAGRMVRVRRFFSAKADAMDMWVKVSDMARRHGRASVTYDAAAHAEYTEAKRIAGGVDLRDVARAWREARPKGFDITVGEAVDKFLLTRQARKLERSYLTGLKSVCLMFKGTFGAKYVAGIRGAEILDWLNGVGAGDVVRGDAAWIAPGTIETRRQRVRSFWSWCVRQEFIMVSPMKTVSKEDLPPVPTSAKETLTLPQCERMMRLLETEYPDYVPWMVVQLFAGIRHTEAGKFRWGWVDFERRALMLPGWAMEKTLAKKEAARVVKTGDTWAMYGLPKNLWIWLRRYRVREDVPFKRPRSQALERLIRERVVKPWPYNCVRHTFCSMMISFYGDAAKVANWSRHRSPKQLYDSYVTRLVPVATAKKFLEILPKPVKRKAGSRALGSGRGEVSTGRRGG